MVSSLPGTGTRAPMQADVADVVLRAGVRAAGQMDIDRSIEREARLAPLGNGDRGISWCWSWRTCSRCCRCRRRGRRARSLPWLTTRSPQGALRLARCASRGRRRSAGSATPSGEYRHRPLMRDVGQLAHLLELSSFRPAARRRPRRGRVASAGGRRCAPADPARAAPSHARPQSSRADSRAWPRPLPGTSRNPRLSSTYFSRAFLRSVRSPLSMNTRTIASATATASFGST